MKLDYGEGSVQAAIRRHCFAKGSDGTSLSACPVDVVIGMQYLLCSCGVVTPLPLLPDVGESLDGLYAISHWHLIPSNLTCQLLL